jgi:predicted acyl esterase
VSAALAGPHSPVKAMAPTVPAYDGYRDFMFPGGMFLRTFMNFFLFASRHATSELTPPDDASTHSVESLATMIMHGGNVAGWTAPAFLTLNSGGNLRYDSGYWRSRDWSNLFPQVVANEVPTLIVGGLWDVFERGAPLHYAGLQNAWAQRRSSLR